MSDCADPARFDQECLDFEMLQDEMASVPPHPPTLVDQSTSETLERHRHSLQLSPRVPSSLCLCLAVLGLDSVRKEKCTCECSKITPIPLLSETTKREWVFEQRTREKALVLSCLPEV